MSTVLSKSREVEFSQGYKFVIDIKLLEEALKENVLEEKILYFFEYQGNAKPIFFQIIYEEQEKKRKSQAYI